MNRVTPLDNNSSTKEKSSMLWVFPFSILIGIICFISACIMVTVPDERIASIEKFNREAQVWNDVYFQEMRKTSFSMTVNSIHYPAHINDTAFGLYYPYRDICNKPNDPQCVESSVYHIDFSIPSSNNKNLLFVLQSSKWLIYNTSLPSIRNVTLTRESLGCSSEKKTCLARCQKQSGIWDDALSLCTVITYLNRVCIRIRKDNSSSLWMVDNPQLYNLGTHSSIGCEISNSKHISIPEEKSITWLPVVYSINATKDITFSVYHAGDSYIRAEAITKGCSSQTIVAANCFGNGKYDNRFWIISFFIIGSISILILIIIIIAFNKQIITIDFLNGVVNIHYPQREPVPTDVQLEDKQKDKKEEEVIDMIKVISNTEDDMHSVISEMSEGTLPGLSLHSLNPHDSEIDNSSFTATASYINYQGDPDGI